MSLELLLNIIADLAIKRNLVDYAAFGPSIYELQAGTIQDYPFIFISPTNNVRTRKNFTEFTVTVFYVDRLLADNTNETHIFSIANDTIVNLLRQLRSLEGIVDVSEPIVRLFTETEKLNDRCAGGYTEVTITVLNDMECPVFFDEEGDVLGTFIPSTLKDLNVLDSLASKEWVARYVSEHGGGGGADENTIKRLIAQALREYTKTEDFAHFNGSGITNEEIYHFVLESDFETFYSAYTDTIEDIYSVLSGVTPEGYEQLVSAVTKNTQDIAELSAYTGTIDVSSLSGAVENLSAVTSGIASDLESLASYTGDIDTGVQVLSAFTSGLSFTVTEQGQNLEQLSAATSGVASDIVALSAATSGMASDLAVLSAYTGSIDLAPLSGSVEALSAATSGIAVDLEALSAYTATLSGGSVAKEDVVLVLAQLTAMTAEQLTAVWEQTEQRYLEGYRILLKGYTNNDTDGYLPLVKYQPYREGNIYTGYFGFSAVEGGGNAFYDVNFWHRGALQGNNKKEFSKKTMYTLPNASASKLGGIKVGSGLTADNNGVLSTQYQIWEGTQAEYEALPSHDNNTFYVIKNATA